MQEPVFPNNRALAKLVWQTPDRKEHEYFFGQGTITIGRSEGNDVVLSNSCVSRCHAKIHWKDGDFFISDMESANGTFVNDQWIKREHLLQDGDRIHVDIPKRRLDAALSESEMKRRRKKWNPRDLSNIMGVDAIYARIALQADLGAGWPTTWDDFDKD